jgi:hypothetical protein
MKREEKMYFMPFIMPVLVFFLEYVAISSALVYARFSMEMDQPTVDLLGGLIKIGQTVPYDAVPNLVVTLHILALLISVSYLVYYLFFYPFFKENKPDIPPQEG